MGSGGGVHVLYILFTLQGGRGQPHINNLWRLLVSLRGTSTLTELQLTVVLPLLLHKTIPLNWHTNDTQLHHGVDQGKGGSRLGRVLPPPLMLLLP